MILMKKAMSESITAILILISLIILVVAIMAYMMKSGLTSSMNLQNEYTAQRADIAMQGIVENFEKTAIFFGLMSAAKELGEHGGVSADIATSPVKTSNLNPKMDAPGGVASWAVARCDNAAGNPTSTIRKRVPFLLYRDRNVRIGTADEQVSLNAIFKYQENVDEVLAGGYRFYALAEIFMRKPGTVEVRVCADSTCQPALPVTQSGTVTIPFGNDILTPNTSVVTLSVKGTDEDIAVLRQVAVSIYDDDFVKDSNTVLSKYVNNYRTGLPPKIQDITLATTPYDATFLSGGIMVSGVKVNPDGNPAGIVWAPGKASLSTSDVFVSGWAGFPEQDLEIRYFRIQRIADWFVSHYADWVKPRWWNSMNNDFRDFDMPGTTQCGSVGYAKCPPDGTPSYTGENFRTSMNADLSSIAADLNVKFAPVGISWELAVPPAPVFAGCTTNIDTQATGLETCKAQNMEAYEYKQGLTHYLGCVSSCGCNPNSCGGGAVAANTPNCIGSSCGAGTYSCIGGRSCGDQSQCTMTYTHRYILKNVPIFVTMTDNNHKTFDSTTNTWAPYKFTFAVEIDKVDDNACRDRTIECSSQTLHAELPRPEPVVSDDVLDSLVAETCTVIPWQSCEPAGTCPPGKAPGLGSCDGGKICCTGPAPPPPPPLPTCAGLGGTYYLLTASCPPAEPSTISKALISDCQEPSSICCTAGPPPPPPPCTSYSIDPLTGGCPIGKIHCTAPTCFDTPFTVCCQ